MDWTDIGWILDVKYACWMFFLDGFGVGPWFLDDLEWILMDFGCMSGWFLGGFFMVLAGFWMNIGSICDGRCMEFCFVMFSGLSEFYDFFEVDGTFMANFMAKFLQSLAR